MAQTRMTFLGVLFLVYLLKIHGVVINEGKSSESSSLTSSTQTQLATALPNTVPWQSAYWALLAIALSAMTQNSTLDRDFPSAILFPMRSSPLVCAADAIEVLLRLLWYMYRARLSATNAACRVVQETTWRPNQPTGSTLTLASQYPLSHTVLFLLGVLPQAVKLFGMRGIPWTHVWASLYLSSYLVLAGVGALARHAGPTTNVPLVAFREREVRLLKFGVVAAQLGVWLWCMWRLLGHLWSSTPPESAIYVTLSIVSVLFDGLACGCVTFLIAAIPAILAWMTNRQSLAVFLFVSGPVARWCNIWGVILVDHLERHSMDSVITFWLLGMTVFLMAGVMFFLRRRFPATFRATINISFGVGNLVFSILYYRFLYDPRGTVKPPWTEKLG